MWWKPFIQDKEYENLLVEYGKREPFKFDCVGHSFVILALLLLENREREAYCYCKQIKGYPETSKILELAFKSDKSVLTSSQRCFLALNKLVYYLCSSEVVTNPNEKNTHKSIQDCLHELMEFKDIDENELGHWITELRAKYQRDLLGLLRRSFSCISVRSLYAFLSSIGDNKSISLEELLGDPDNWSLDDSGEFVNFSSKAKTLGKNESSKKPTMTSLFSELVKVSIHNEFA